MTRLEFLRNADALADKYSNEHLSFKIEQGDPFTIERGYLIINVYVNNLYTEFISTNIYNSDNKKSTYFVAGLKKIEKLLKNRVNFSWKFLKKIKEILKKGLTLYAYKRIIITVR